MRASTRATAAVTMTGRTSDGEVRTIELFSSKSAVANPSFDVTPARYVTGLITEYGVCKATRRDLEKLRERAPERSIPTR